LNKSVGKGSLPSLQPDVELGCGESKRYFLKVSQSVEEKNILFGHSVPINLVDDAEYRLDIEATDLILVL
jgi:hypothetical protein